MKILKTRKSLILIGAILLTVLMIPFALLNAQTNENELIVTWQAQNFYPSDYQGKANVAEDSSVLLSATGIINNRVIDLSNAEFSWYIDNSLYKKSIGASEIIFNANKNSGSSYFVRVEVNSSNGNFERAKNISVEDQEVIIEKSSYSSLMPKNGEITLKGTPYFFNVSSINDLSFFWEINGALQENKQRFISIKSNNEYLTPRQNIIKSIISNNQSPTESARKTIQLIK